MHTYLLARQGRSKEIDAVSILLQSVIISTGVNFRHLPPFQSPRSPPRPLFAVCVSQSLRSQACLQSGSPLLLCRALLSPLRACYSYSDPCSTSKTQHRENKSRAAEALPKVLAHLPARIAPTLFRKPPRTVQRRGYVSGFGARKIRWVGRWVRDL
jgi:hypothetical protein